MKIDKQIIEDVLKEHLENTTEVENILREIEERAYQKQEHENVSETDNSEKRFVTLLFCSEEDLKVAEELTQRTTAFSFRIKSEDNHLEIVNSLISGAQEYNRKKRKKNKIKNLAEACETISPKKHLNGFPEKILNREAAIVIPILNVGIQNANSESGDI